MQVDGLGRAGSEIVFLTPGIEGIACGTQTGSGGEKGFTPELRVCPWHTDGKGL